MMRQIIIISATLFIAISAFGQRPKYAQSSPSKIKVSGTIIDSETNSPLEYASIAFYATKDSSIIGGGLSDETGGFNFELSPKPMYAIVEYISYSSEIIDPIPLPEGGNIVNLGEIILMPEGELLDDIEITAERSETTFSLDKRVFNVGKDLANRGGTAEDILDNVPSVTVDIDGNVSLRGSDGVRLLIDGRPSSLVGAGNSNGLRSLPSNMIEKVEVITNPSARYEAEGMAGIINIVLKKNESAGINGAVDLNYGFPFRTGAALNLNYRKNKLNWFVNSGINYRTGPGGGNTLQDQLLFDDINQTEYRQISVQKRDMQRNSLSNSFRFGADYFFTEKEQLTAALLYRKSDDDNLTTLTYKDYIGAPSDFPIDPFYSKDIDYLKEANFDNVENDVVSHTTQYMELPQ